MSTSLICSQVRQSSRQLYQNILDANGSLSHTKSLELFLPALISITGSIVGLSIGSIAGLSSSRVYCLLGNALGTVPLLLGVEAACSVLCSQNEKLDLILEETKFHEYENIEIAEKLQKELKLLQFQFNTFISSLEPEQDDIFFSVLDEWDYYTANDSHIHPLVNPKSQFNLEVDPLKAKELEEIASYFVLTLKQKDLIDRIVLISPVEEKQIKGMEILCKIFSAEEKGELGKLATALMLTPRQKHLFNDFVSTLKKEKMNEEVIYATIQLVLQAKVNAKISSSFGQQFKNMQAISFLAVPIGTLLTMLKPIALLEIIKPLGILWGALQVGSLFAGALAVAYIFHQCFYSNIHDEIRSQALQLRN